MLLQEELTRNLVSLTSQTLFTTMTMANSAFFWVSSLTPAVTESLTKAGASVFNLGTPFLFGPPHKNDESSTTFGGAGSSAEQGAAASYYYNAIHTVILLLTIWIYFKTFSLVWRSVSAVWETTVGVWKIMGFFASKLRAFAKRWGLHRLLFRNGQQPQESEDEEEVVLNNNNNNNNHESSSQTTSINSPIMATAAANTNTTATATATARGQNPFLNSPEHPCLQSQFLSPPPLPFPHLQGIVWYYYNPVTHTIMPWLPPPHTLPPQPFAPVPMGAPLAHNQQASLPPQDSFFLPIPETEGGTGQNNNIANNHDPGMGNANFEYSPQLGSPVDKTCPDKTTGIAAMDDSDETMVVNTRESVATQPVVDSTTAIAAANANANANANTAAANANTEQAAFANHANPKKRKSLSPCDGGIDSEAALTSTSTSTAQPTEASATRDSTETPSKKQRGENDKANARAWAE